jgi:hypothetical protein
MKKQAPTAIAIEVLAPSTLSGQGHQWIQPGVSLPTATAPAFLVPLRSAASSAVWQWTTARGMRPTGFDQMAVAAA